MYNHYIRLTDNKIIKGFSTAFEQAEPSDILIAENTQERHFILFDTINPALTDEQGIAKFKYVSGKVVARTAQEIEADRPAPIPAVSEIVLAIDNQVITTAQVATVTAIIQGVSVEDFSCYITVNGPPAEKADVVAGQVVREFTSAEPGLFKVEFFVSDKTKAVIIEVV